MLLAQAVMIAGVVAAAYTRAISAAVGIIAAASLNDSPDRITPGPTTVVTVSVPPPTSPTIELAMGAATLMVTGAVLNSE